LASRVVKAAGRTDEEHGDPLAFQPTRHHALVRRLDEGTIGGSAVHERVDLSSEHGGLVLRATQVLLEPFALCIAEPV
jgi:hypothetical protein